MTRVRACVGLGSNIGDGVRTVGAAIEALAALEGIRVDAASKLYRSPAWGMTDQPDFINAVAVIDTILDAAALLEILLSLERVFGRDRTADALRWGPRTLDLDLLLYGDAVIDVPGLRVPHPHLHERAFVLVPLLELMPDAIIPGVGRARDAVERVAADALALRPIDALP